jgi:hypothetical protein
LAALIAGAFSTGYVATIGEAAHLLGCHVQGNPLATATQVKQQLERYGLAMRPAIESGDFDDQRVIVACRTQTEYSAEIGAGESSEQEFKATLLYNIAQAAAEATKAPGDLDHETCSFAVLRSICGFLNRRGGVLYIGVANDGSVYGLQNDLLCLRRHQTFDEWELVLQSLISSRLTQGKRVLSQLGISLLDLDGRKVCRIAIPACSDEVFVRDRTGKCHFYVRSGNRTDELLIEDISSFIRERLRQERI